jgi:hypothetical protein
MTTERNTTYVLTSAFGDMRWTTEPSRVKSTSSIGVDCIYDLHAVTGDSVTFLLAQSNQWKYAGLLEETI